MLYKILVLGKETIAASAMISLSHKFHWWVILTMSRVQELINLLAEKEVVTRASIAKANRICKICGEPADYFCTPRAELEYSISMICQSCQDYFFPKEHWPKFSNLPKRDGSVHGRFFWQSLSVDRKKLTPSGVARSWIIFNPIEFMQITDLRTNGMKYALQLVVEKMLLFPPPLWQGLDPGLVFFYGFIILQ